MTRHWKAFLLSFAILIPVGFWTKHYQSNTLPWVRASLGGAFYEIFWCLLAGFLLPRAKSRTIAAWVLAITCGLEFLQLWHPPALEAARATFPGATILGSSFDWGDFPYYFIGSACGWLWLYRIRRS
ncbi:MAG TPA: DUF2809 domain-containing protein [Bryobacteraceae bacterium]|nr:DUF2809 domain-containing protein [Bryobacteraceae bacterium]